MYRPSAVIVLLSLALAATGCGDGGDSGEALTVYSGRAENLVGPILERFEDETGIDLEVRYGGTPELTNAILEEGDNSPAEVFFAQDAGGLGALAEAGRLSDIDGAILNLVPSRFRSDKGQWVGVSGRVRVVSFNPERVPESELPDSVYGFTDPQWRGRVGWAPANGSFQTFVTGLRVLRGEESARGWLEGMATNDTEIYPNNITIVEAVGRGEIDVGLVNHYYLNELKKQNPGIDAENHFFAGGDPGGLVNVAGVGILEPSAAANRLATFLLEKEAQEYFANKTFEYPLIDGVEPSQGLPPLASLEPPDIDLSDLADLRGTQGLLTEVGIL